MIFDLDGTLWDTREPVVRIWNDVFEAQGHGRPLTSAMLTGLMGKPMSEFGKAIFPDLPAEVREPLIRRAEQQENNGLLATGKDCLYPSAKAVIRGLARDHWIGIASNCQEGYIETFLQVSGLEDVVDGFISNGETNLDKDRNIRILMERNGLDQAVYIGDTDGDKNCAAVAGLPFIWCRYGFGRDVAKSGIDDLLELPEKLNRN